MIITLIKMCYTKTAGRTKEHPAHLCVPDSTGSPALDCSQIQAASLTAGIDSLWFPAPWGRVAVKPIQC